MAKSIKLLLDIKMLWVSEYQEKGLLQTVHTKRINDDTIILSYFLDRLMSSVTG